MNILIIRNFANKVNPNSYNLQEIGLGKALVSRGFSCDIIYYNREYKMNIENIFEIKSNRLRILWLKGLKVFNNSIYINVLNKRFLKNYDLIITTEYNQIMSFLLSIICPEKVLLYHGPYKDNNNIMVRKIYDLIFLPLMKRNLNNIYVKSDLAKQYLIDKGFINVETVGVGLDISKIEQKNENMSEKIDEQLHSLEGKKVLLYLGVLEERRNISFLLRVFHTLLHYDSELMLLLVGDGKQTDKDFYWNYINENDLSSSVISIPNITQDKLWKVYGVSDVMLFPTNYDIFGMVLLESMFFKVPIISSINGGASVLIENNVNGLIIDQFDEQLWVSEILRLINDDHLIEEIKQRAYQTATSATWGNIVERMFNKITLLNRGGEFDET